MAQTSQPCPTFPKAETPAIARGRLSRAAARPLLTSGLAAIALALPAIVQAQGQCPAVQAIISDDASALNGLGITINGSGSLDVVYFGQAGALRDADSCQIDSPNDAFDLTCTWNFTTLEADEAKRTFDVLLKRVGDCLPVGFESREQRQISADQLEELRARYGQSYVDFVSNTETLEDHGQTIDLAAGDEVDVHLVLKRKKETGRLWISAGFYRD